jgi:hypothetical protein
MPSLLPYHFCLRGYEGCEIVDQAAEAGWDTTAFLADGTLSYHDMPRGTDTFPKGEMMHHLIDYHKKFGLRNQPHLLRSIDVLRENGYTDCDLVDMYSVLQNHAFRDVDEIVAGATPSVNASVKVPNVNVSNINASNRNSPNLKANA